MPSFHPVCKIGKVVEFHLRAFRVLRGEFLPISTAKHSICTSACLTKDRRAVARSFVEPPFPRRNILQGVAHRGQIHYSNSSPFTSNGNAEGQASETHLSRHRRTRWHSATSCKIASFHEPLSIDSPQPLRDQSGFDRTPTETLGRFATLNRLDFPIESGLRSIRFVLT